MATTHNNTQHPQRPPQQQRIATESQEQRALVKWIRTQSRFDGLLVKLNNEGKRSLAQGWNLKLLGMETGASDLFLAYPTARHHGLWLEMKQCRKYTPSEMRKPTWMQQLAFIERMKNVGFAGHIVFGWEHGKELIENYCLGNL